MFRSSDRSYRLADRYYGIPENRYLKTDSSLLGKRIPDNMYAHAPDPIAGHVTYRRVAHALKAGAPLYVARLKRRHEA